MSAELLILVDDQAGSQDLQAEHGLAVMVRGPGKRVLFDVGASAAALLGNAQALGVELAELDAAVVSHGHCDHTGGLAALALRRRGLGIYAHPSAFLRRWTDRPGEPLKDISCPHSLSKLCQAGAAFHAVKAPEMLADWLVLSGPIGGPKYGREPFVVRKADEMVVDGFEDEMFCLVRGREDWTVLTGCCHRGLDNTLRAAKFLTRGRRIAALVGGLHLRSAAASELATAVELLKAFGPIQVYPCHCTGRAAVDYLAEHLPNQVHPLTAGSRVVF